MTGFNIVADQNMAGVEDYFQPLGTVRLVAGRQLVAADLVDVEVLLVRSVTQVNRALLAESSVRFVGTATSGFDHVDRDYLRQNHIGFSHAPGSNANSVVEYVLAVIASIDDKLEKLLAGKPVGIIGYGNVGRALAARCTALGISFKAYDPWLAVSSMDNPADLREVLDCEVISIHAELTRNEPWSSHHLLGENELRGLSEQTLLINAARGELVDNQALLRLRQQGLGPCSVLDVWEGEPTLMPELLAQLKWGTAHIAGYSLDGKYLATRMLRDAVIDYFDLACTDRVQGLAPALPIKAPAGLRGVQLLRWALAARYRIDEDDRLLRETMIDATGRERGLAFDHLRKSYRIRRELSGSSVLTSEHAEQAPLLTALACVVDASEPSS